MLSFEILISLFLNVLGYYRNLGSLRYGTSTASKDVVWEKRIVSSSTEAFFNHAV